MNGRSGGQGLHVVASHAGVPGDNHQPPDARLSDQQPIERVGVVIGQPADGKGVIDRDVQAGEPKSIELVNEVVGGTQPAQRPFDRDLTRGGCREAASPRIGLEVLLDLVRQRVVEVRRDPDPALPPTEGARLGIGVVRRRHLHWPSAFPRESSGVRPSSRFSLTFQQPPTLEP